MRNTNCKAITGAIVAAILSAWNLHAAAADFVTRCSSPDVVRCVGFDSAAQIAGGYGSNSGIFSGAATPAIDTGIKASGAGSLKFVIPPNAASDTSGSFFTNFSTDLSVQFGAGSKFYVQWRQRLSKEFVNTIYDGNGWKQIIIGTGDVPGGRFQGSCTELELVVQNSYHRGFPQMYNSCTGSSTHRAYDAFEVPINGGADYKMQNGRPSPYCLYSQGATKSYAPPAGNCFMYFADEWLTFQIEVTLGPRVNDEFSGSQIRMWIARENQSSQLVFDFGPYNLTAGPVANDYKFGKLWLLPYNSGRTATSTYATAYTWYDDLIISRAKIPDPDATTPTVRPNPPTGVTARPVAK